MNRSRITSIAFLAVLVGTALGLGVVAPANALQAPPVLDPNAYKVNAPTGVYVDAAPTGQSAGQLANLGKSGSGIPAFKAAPLTKVIGGVTQVVSNFNGGLAIGKGVNSALWGVDTDAGVCGTTGSDFWGQALQVVSGADCAAKANELAATFVPNTDAGGYSMASYCYSGNCLTFKGEASSKLTNWSGNLVGQAWYCFAVTSGTPSALVGASLYLIYKDSLGTVMASNSTGLGSSVAPDGTACGSPTSTVAMTIYQVKTSNGGSAATAASYLAGSTPLCVRRFGDLNCSGDATPIVKGSADPVRDLTCNLKDMSGAIIASKSVTWKESEPLPQYQCPALPSSANPVGSMEIVQGDGKGGTNTLLSQPSTPGYRDLQTKYPQCLDGTCMLDLMDGTGSCFDGAVSRCDGWAQDPNKDSKYVCRYGGQTLALASCNIYANVFSPQKIAGGQPYPDDPATGGTKGSQTGPKVSDGPTTAPDTGEDRKDCFPTGWGVLNPFEWVYKPVRCVVNWAFVPRASKVDEFEQDVKNKWGASTPGKYMTALASLTAALGSFNDGGCSGITVNLSGIAPDILHLGTYHFLPSCPGDFFAPFAPPFKVLIGVGFILTGFFGVKRITAGLVNQGNE